MDNLNRTFCTKEYKSHRKQLLIDREMSKLPETMHLAERQKLVDIEEKKMASITEKIKSLTKELNQYKLERSNISMKMYNIGNGIKTSIKEVAQLLIELTGSDLEIEYEPAGITFVKNRVGSIEKAQREIEFKAKVSLKEGMKKLIEWRQMHKDAVEKRRKKIRA